MPHVGGRGRRLWPRTGGHESEMGAGWGDSHCKDLALTLNEVGATENFGQERDMGLPWSGSG